VLHSYLDPYSEDIDQKFYDQVLQNFSKLKIFNEISKEAIKECVKLLAKFSVSFVGVSN
jgi:hypothetical protein